MASQSNSITPTQRTEKDIMAEYEDRSILLLNIEAKILNKILAK